MLKKLHNYTVNDTQLHNKCKKNTNNNILNLTIVFTLCGF